MHIDEEALQLSLQRLREAAIDADVVAVMKRAVGAVDKVFGCSGAGIMFVTQAGRLSYVAASDEPGRRLEEAQVEAGQGPCYDSYVYAREIVSRDVHDDSRWPKLPPHLPEQVRAVLGIPVNLGGSPVGTLNVYRDAPADWDDSDISALRAYGDLIADIVSAALAAQDHGELANQLQYALDYRVIIERAIGYLMGSLGLDPVTSFDVLRKRARDTRRRVADVAAEVLGGTNAGANDRPPL